MEVHGNAGSQHINLHWNNDAAIPIALPRTCLNRQRGQKHLLSPSSSLSCIHQCQICQTQQHGWHLWEVCLSVHYIISAWNGSRHPIELDYQHQLNSASNANICHSIIHQPLHSVQDSRHHRWSPSEQLTRQSILQCLPQFRRERPSRKDRNATHVENQ